MVETIGIIHTWPDVRNAEYEVLQRLITAAANVGQKVVVIDNDGLVLWASPGVQVGVGEILPPGTVRYVISLHFDSPRVLDVYSYYAVWQPIEFYYDFGYIQSMDKLSSHNDLLSCDSDLADAHVRNIFSGHGREPLFPLIRLFHSPARPYLTPNITEDAKLFYIGINWERIGRPKGRFHDTLVSLDQQGLTNIYGPQKILGVAPWEGFKTYQGELPFDGRSVMRAINRAGICLALSSAQHRATGIMSNRLFEGFAGGAAVITTPNPIIDKHFAHCVYLVDDSRGEDVLGQMIVEAVREIRDDREEAMRRAREGQRILNEICSLEQSLQTLADTHTARLAHFEKHALAEFAEITVVLCDIHGSATLLRERLADYAAQRNCAVDLHLICDEVVAAQIKSDSSPSGAVRNFTVHAADFAPRADQFDGVKRPPMRTGPIVHRILSEAITPFFAIASASDVPFSDHLASLSRALNDDSGATFVASGFIAQTRDRTGRRSRTLGALQFANFEALLLVNGASQQGRFLFRTSLLKNDWSTLMTLLDGEEVRLYQLAATLQGKLAQTGYASTVCDEAIDIVPRALAEPPSVQQQYIRDRFRCDTRWIDLVARESKLPGIVHAYAPGAPVRWRDFTVAAASTLKMPLDQMLPLRTGAPALDYLGAGFSHPEEDHIWLAADRGIIDFALDAIESDSMASREIGLLLAGRRSPSTGREQHCTIVLNGSTIAYLPLPDYPHEVRIPIPNALLERKSAYRLELVPDHCEPAGGGDQRHVSISLRGIGVFSQRIEQAAKLEVGIVYSCGVGSLGTDALVRGFYAAEPDLRWMAGVNAHAAFLVMGSARNPALMLGVRVRDSEHGERQRLSLAFNGRLLATLALPDGNHQLVLPLTDGDLLTHVHLEVGLDHAEVTRDGDGRIVDGRLLGCAIRNLGVVDAERSPELLQETEKFIVSDGVE